MSVALFNSIRVLVVDDSPSARQLLRGILESEPDVEVVGVAVDAYDFNVGLRLKNTAQQLTRAWRIINHQHANAV
ncbi:MAG: hypothetical protein AAFQ99_00635, partial [Pseudomonadota bacterium]